MAARIGGDSASGRALLDPLRDALALAPVRDPSEYRLANLFLYRGRHDYRLEHEGDGDGPALFGTTYDGERHAMPFGPLTPARADRLLDRAACLYPIPEAEAGALAAAGFAVDHRDADSDYLYEAAALARLTGAKAKRAQAAGFARDAAPSVEALTPANVELARRVLDGWLADVGRAPAATDLVECGAALDHLAALALDGLLVRAAGVPVGFLLASAPRDGERVVHFAKGRRAGAGVYPWMFAHYAATCGAARLNFEQDLGNPGLAQAKRALAPGGRRRKMRVRRAA